MNNSMILNLRIIKDFFKHQLDLSSFEQSIHIDFKNQMFIAFEIIEEEVWNEDEESQVMEVYNPIASFTFKEFDNWCKQKEIAEKSDRIED